MGFVCVLESHLTLCDPMNCRVAHQAPLPMEFSRQEYWNVLPFLTPGDLADLETELASLASPALAGRFFTTLPSGKPKIGFSLPVLFGLWQGECFYIFHSVIQKKTGLLPISNCG